MYPATHRPRASCRHTIPARRLPAFMRPTMHCLILILTMSAHTIAKSHTHIARTLGELFTSHLLHGLRLMPPTLPQDTSMLYPATPKKDVSLMLVFMTHPRIIHRILVGAPANRLSQHPIEHPIEGDRVHAPSHSASEGGLHARAYSSLVARKAKKAKGKPKPKSKPKAAPKAKPRPAPVSNSQSKWSEANKDIKNVGTTVKNVGSTVSTIASVGKDVASVLGDFFRREVAARELEDWIIARAYESDELD